VRFLPDSLLYKRNKACSSFEGPGGRPGAAATVNAVLSETGRITQHHEKVTLCSPVRGRFYSAQRTTVGMSQRAKSRIEGGIVASREHVEVSSGNRVSLGKKAKEWSFDFENSVEAQQEAGYPIKKEIDCQKRFTASQLNGEKRRFRERAMPPVSTCWGSTVAGDHRPRGGGGGGGCVFKYH